MIFLFRGILSSTSVNKINEIVPMPAYVQKYDVIVIICPSFKISQKTLKKTKIFCFHLCKSSAWCTCIYHVFYKRTWTIPKMTFLSKLIRSLLTLSQNAISLSFILQASSFFMLSARIPDIIYFKVKTFELILVYASSVFAWRNTQYYFVLSRTQEHYSQHSCYQGAFDSHPQVIKFTSCLPMVGGSLRVLRLLPPLKLVAMI